MPMVPVNPGLRQLVCKALEMPFRFERTDRFAMSQLLRCRGADNLVDEVFVATARNALRRHSMIGRETAKRPAGGFEHAA